MICNKYYPISRLTPLEFDRLDIEQYNIGFYPVIDYLVRKETSRSKIRSRNQRRARWEIHWEQTAVIRKQEIYQSQPFPNILYFGSAMQRSIIEHQIELTLYVYEVYVKIPEAEQFYIGWRIGKQSLETPCKVGHDERGRIIMNTELTLSMKMAYDANTDSYREKKGFLMFFYTANKQNKLGGVLTLDVAKLLTQQNKDSEYLLEDYQLEKSPDRTAAICLGFKWRLLSESSFLNKSFILNESNQSFRSDNRHNFQRQINELCKQNHQIKLENESLKQQVNVMVGEIQTLLVGKQHLEEENRYLRTIQIQNQNSLRYEIELEENNLENSKIKSVLSENDLQDLRALEVIREECLKLQSLKTEDSDGAEYKEEIVIRDNEIERLNEILKSSKQRIDTLQYLNNLLLKEEEAKDAKICKLEESLERASAAYDQITIKKQEMEMRLEEEIEILTVKIDEIETDLVNLREENSTMSKQILKSKQSIRLEEQRGREQSAGKKGVKERVVLMKVIELLRSLNIDIMKVKRHLVGEIALDGRNNKTKEAFGSVRRMETELQTYLELFSLN